LKTDSDPKSVKAFQKARKAFQIFNRSWEKWVYQELLDRSNVPMNAQTDETYWAKDVREKAWAALMSMNAGSLFTDRYDHNLKKHVPAPWELDQYDGGRKRIITRYNRHFSAAFKAIEDLINQEAKLITLVKPDEQVQVHGVNIRIKNMTTSDFHAKYLKRFMDALPKAVKAIKKSGFKKAMRGFSVEINFKAKDVPGIPGGLTAGAYDKDKDKLYILPLGLNDNLSDSTLIHEIGHRYWFRDVPPNAQKSWNDKIDSRKVTITKDHIDKFFDRYYKEYGFENRKDIEADAKKNVHDPILNVIFTELADRTPFFMVKEGEDQKTRYYQFMIDNHVGNKVNLEFISDYGNTNPAEAFAEVFRKWVAGRVGTLGPWTRQFFKDIVRTGGANIRESKIKTFDRLLKQ